MQKEENILFVKQFLTLLTENSFSFIFSRFSLYLFVAFHRNTMTDDGIELVLTVMEAKELIAPSIIEQFDTFVRIYLVPDETHALQTKVM